MMTSSLNVVQVLKDNHSATVVKAWDNELKQYVILKKVPLSDLALREIEILKELDHSSIPRLLNSYIDNDVLYTTMEFKNGQTLRDLLDSERLTEKHVISIVRQLASIILYLHKEAKIVHRDIKLENVLIDDTFNVSLIDFGFADYLTNNLTERIGSPAYCSPELILGGPYGASTDIWSLGVLTHCLLDRSFPFDGETIEAVFESICFKHAPIAEMTGVSTECKSFLAQLLCKDRNKRLTIEQVLEHAWLAVKPKIKSLSHAIGSVHRKSLPIVKPRVTRSLLGRLFS